MEFWELFVSVLRVLIDQTTLMATGTVYGVLGVVFLLSSGDFDFLLAVGSTVHTLKMKLLSF